MAGKGAVLAIRIISDASKAAKGFRDAEGKVGEFSRGLDRAAVASAAVLTGIGAIAASAFEQASRAQQAAGALESVFGESAKNIRAVSEDAATSVGLSTAAYEEMASVLGASLKNMGMDQEAASRQTSKLIQYGADLAATYGGTTADAVSALGSLLRGEADPIERYGIGIKAADIEARLAAQGMGELEGAAREAASTEAMMALIVEQAGGALGGYAREADTASGATQTATAKWENAQAALGEVLLPIVSEVAGKLAELATWFTENKDTVIPLIAVVAGLAAAVIAVNAALSVYRAIAAVATAAQWAWNIAMAANPITFIILAVLAVIAAVIWAYQEFEVVRNVIGAVVDAVVGYINIWIDAIKWVWEAIQALGDVFASVFNWIMSVIQPVVDIFSWIIDKLSMIGDAAAWVGGLFGAGATMAVTPVATGSVQGVFGAASAGAAGASAPVFGAPMSALAGGGSTAGQGPAGMTVNIRIDGALDPVAVGRQVEKALRDYGRATGRQVALTMGRA